MISHTQNRVKYWLVLVLLVASFHASAQFVPATFKKTVDSLIRERPSYTDIHNVLRDQRNDTVLMRYLEDVATDKGFREARIYALNQLGRRFRNLSEYAKSIKLHEQALEIANEADNLEFRVSSLNMLGVVYRRISSLRTAMDYNQQALELAETVENPSYGLKRNINVSLNCIGNLYQALEQYDFAIDHFEKSLVLEAELGNKLGLAVNHQNIGECQESLGELDKALENYRMSLSYNEVIDNDMGRVICKNSIAQIYIKKDRYEDALNILGPTLSIAQNLGDKFLSAPVYINLGWAQMLIGNDAEARTNLMAGLEVAKTYDLKESASRASHLLADLFKKTGDYQVALGYQERAEGLDREILNEKTVRYVNEVFNRYDREKLNNQLNILAKEKELADMKLAKKNDTLLISGIALALLAGIFYILYRQYQLKNEKKVLTLEQSMLRSQMNPHFLFNSLNSIKLYIINNEQKNAVHYLNKFSKLIRKILEASSVREIPLAEELETVELYMNIENIRFSNEIDFKIRVDEDVDPHTIKVPSLVLQPFLENALWHGLSSKNGTKKIEVHVKRGKQGMVLISITDNGVGRKEAEKIKQGKVLKRKSVGIGITQERLANFSKDYLNSSAIEIIDLYNDQGEPTGTRVVISIPTA